MKPANRIILNTVATYGQSLLGLVLSLFSARWILHALGEVDFGLFGVVGSVILLITFLNGGLSIGVARFYAFSIGRGHTLPKQEAIDDLKRWFNTAFLIHLVLPFLLILIGWPIGEYAIHHWLTIPPERIDACIWVFRISLASAFLNVFSVPFTSMYAAHQLISELALFGIFQSICGFVGAWFLLHAQSDRLIFYALYMTVISSGTTLIQIIRAIVKFKACRPCISYLYDRYYLKQLFGYVSWKMFGMSCVVLRTQGVPVLTNLFFGPLVNAAYSVANRVSIQATSLSSAMMGAFQPAVTSAEGKGDRQKMLEMTMQASKFGTLLVLFFVIPLTLEMKTVLHLWLVNPPLYADELCQWMLAILVIDRMTSGSMLAVNALGRIAAYELIQGSVIALSLPLMWLLFHLEMGPVSIGGALFVSTAIYCAGRLAFSKYLLQLPVSAWIRQVAIPVSLLIVGASAAGVGIMLIFDAGFFRLCLTSAVTTAVTAGIGWLWLLTTVERQHFIGLIKGALSRFNPSNKSASIFPSK